MSRLENCSGCWVISRINSYFVTTQKPRAAFEEKIGPNLAASRHRSKGSSRNVGSSSMSKSATGMSAARARCSAGGIPPPEIRESISGSPVRKRVDGPDVYQVVAPDAVIDGVHDQRLVAVGRHDLDDGA